MTNPSSSQANIFVATIDTKLADKLITDLKSRGFTLSTPAYTIFSAKKPGISCTLYQSGKLTVQGKEMATFIEFYLEPEILHSFSFSHPTAHPIVDLNLMARIGIDESGKGDFFGPLCVAGVFAEGDAITRLKTLGVKDSKNLSDKQIREIAAKIRANYVHTIVKINPAKYNEIYAQFKNLNRLLGWGHATAIESLIERTGCKDVIIDQFADESVVETALKRKKIKLNLTQRHRGEEDLVVAAASILAREAFIEGLDKLSREYELLLPKGASAATIAAGKKFLHKYGKDQLRSVAKLHFKTLEAVTRGE